MFASHEVRTLISTHVIEEEHEPNVHCTQGGKFGCHDDCRLLVGIVLCKVTHCCKQLSRLVGCEKEIPSPDLMRYQLTFAASLA